MIASVVKTFKDRNLTHAHPLQLYGAFSLEFDHVGEKGLIHIIPEMATILKNY